MLSQLRYILKYYLFWILFFILLKLIFLLYFFRLSFPVFSQWDNIFFHGLRLDLSACGYILILPMLIVLIAIFLPGNWAKISIRMYTLILVAVFVLFSIFDLIAYGDWGFRMDATPLFYLSSPKAAAASASILSIVLHLLVAIAIFIIVFVGYNKLFKQDETLLKKKAWWTAPIILILLGSLFFPIRGGLGTSPMNIGTAYFSDNAFVNHAAINLPWNIGYSLTNLETVDNPYRFMADEKAEILKSGFIKSDTGRMDVLSNNRPNIILVILESFTANAAGCLNGIVQVTPNLDEIAGKGMLFTQCYASGNRTDKGMVAILSGYPSQPLTSIIKFPNKTQSLPALPRKLKENGYGTYFYYGGDIEFANYKSYMINAGFEKLISVSDFPKSQQISNWGVPDEYLFEKVHHDLKGINEPYMLTLFSLSSHPPFDVPMEPYLKGNDVETKFCNSVYYTDRCLGAFINNLEKDGLLTNTLVIITADHGSTWPGKYGNSPPEKFHIPLIWYGGALLVSDSLIHTVVNQTDIAVSLLNQLGIDNQEFEFGKDMFARNTPGKTIYAFNNGFGYVSDSLTYYYERDPDKTTIIHGNINEAALNEGKAFMQVLHEDLMNR